jgi:hypothetical protein
VSFHCRKTSSLPFLDEFRWRGTAENDSASRNEYIWDWLLNGLDLARVRQTLRCFPTYDLLTPSPISDVEVWVPAQGGRGDDMMEIDEVEDGSTYSMFGHDKRYSPGYILPLILAAFENCMEEEATAEETGLKQAVENTGITVAPSSHNEMLARVAQRLCEKGGLSLTLATLCSNCPSLRQIAVAILGFFLKAVDTKEAREVSSWRERPQIAMLLHSVHRALAIRRAVLLSESHKADSSVSESTVWEVPMFPGFSAIFLARSSLALMRPGDSLFAPLNRFFLSIDGDHGAFRDMNRLPAFVTLLCSSADEPGQARKERLWALELFRDGFVDKFCFRMSSNSHSPELLLTTFYNYRMRTDAGGTKQQEEECLLLLEAFARMVKYGGRHAARNLVVRMGLLSWFHSVLVSAPVLEILPTISCRAAFFQLIAASVRQASRYEASNIQQSDVSFLVECVALAEPTLQLCLSSFDDSRVTTEKQTVADDEETLSSSVASALEVLKALQSALLSMKLHHEDTSRSYDVRSDGLMLASALRFLEKVASSLPDGRKDALEALVSLPICPRGSKNDAAVFCGVILDVLIDKTDALKDRAVQALQRVLLALDLFLDRSKSTTNELATRLIECRSTCFRWTESRDLWFCCLKKICQCNDFSTEQQSTSVCILLCRQLLDKFEKHSDQEWISKATTSS